MCINNFENVDLVIENIGELITCSATAQDSIGLLKNVAVIVSDGVIVKICPQSDVKNIVSKHTRIINAQKNVVAPGFVDCHTHVVFGGQRVEEYTLLLEGMSLSEMSDRGVKTGIRATVDVTRSMSKHQLFDQSKARVIDMILAGTTSIEIKSGYGLDQDTELKQLNVIRELKQLLPVDIYATYLGGHGCPLEIDKETYINFMIEKMIPLVAKEGLAEFCDIWCEANQYSKEDCRRVLSAGQRYGLQAKIHTDQHSYIGGSELAAEIRAVSADHLNYTPLAVIKQLVASNVTGVVLPGIDFAIKHHQPFNVQPMIAEGLELGLGTNCCPSCWCTSMSFIITLACRNHALSPARAIRAATYGAAKAIGKANKIGSIEVGKKADIQIWNINDYRDIAYHYGANPVDTVIKNGTVIVDNGKYIYKDK